MIPAVQRHAFFARRKARSEARAPGDWLAKERALVAGCHPKQRDFVLDEARRICALVAGRGGKTTGGRVRLVRRMLMQPRARCLFIAQSRPTAEELTWLPLKDLLERLGIAADFNETKLRCTFRRNGSTLRLVGADDKRQIDKLRGQPFHEIGIDEAASHPDALLQNLISRVLGPRLGDYKGTLWLIGTPGHQLTDAHLFYSLTKPSAERSRPWAERHLPQFVGWKGWSSHRWNLPDAAPYVPAIQSAWEEAQDEKARQGWGDDHPIWRCEYLGEWVATDQQMVFKYTAETADGKLWNQWDPPRDDEGFAELPDVGAGEWHFVYGFDLGHSDPTAIVILAWNDGDAARTLYHVYEFEQRGMYARLLAEMLLGKKLDLENAAGLIGKTGWPDAMDADIKGLGGSLLDELANVYGIRMKAAEQKNRIDAIEIMNGDLIEGRMKILKGSKLEGQLLGLQWATDEYGRLVKNKAQRDDLADAAIYARRRAGHLIREAAPPPEKKRETAFERVGKERERLEEEAQVELAAGAGGEFDDLLRDDADYMDDDWQGF